MTVTSQTSEHFLLRKFVGTSELRVGVFTVTSAFLWLIVRERPRWRGGMCLLLPFLGIGFLEVAAMWDPNWFPAARPFSHGRKLGKCTGIATQSQWECGMGHKRNRRSSHICVPKRTQNRYTKTVARKFKRHVMNHSGLGCCATMNAQPHAEQTRSTEQDLRCVLIDRGHLRGLEQLKQNLDVCKKKKEEHKHVRPIAQGRTRRATTTTVCQTHGLAHTAPASGVAINPTASMVRVERNINAVRQVNQWKQSCDGLRRHLWGPTEECKPGNMNEAHVNVMSHEPTFKSVQDTNTG